MTGRSGSGHRAVRATLGSAVALTVVLGATGCTSGSSSTAASAATSGAGISEAAPALGVGAAGVTSAAPAAATSAAAAAATSGAAAAPADAPAAAASAAAGGSGAPANNGSVEGRVVLQNDATAGRSIIYTATLTLQVPKPADVATAANQAAHLAETNDGYLFSREQQDANSPTPTPTASGQPQPANTIATADLTLKVPPSQYDALIGELQRLGTQLDIEAHTQDVTDQVVDTQARLTTQKASVERIRTLLTKATTIGQIVEVEGQLTQREADLESLEGKLAVLKSQTALATVTVHLESAPPKVVVVPPKPKPVPKPKHKIHGFVGGLDAGGRGFATVAIAFATVVGAVLPFLGLFLVLAVIAWWGRRVWLKNRRRAPEQVTP